MFGDRLFYRDWWNANTIEAYWRLWNLPVHYWMVSDGQQHTAVPTCRRRMGNGLTIFLCMGQSEAPTQASRHIISHQIRSPHGTMPDFFAVVVAERTHISTLTSAST